MTKEFNLSDKIRYVEDYNLSDEKVVHQAVEVGVVEIKDVKEFIRLLKEKIKSNSGCEYMLNWEDIDKIAGEKLK